MSKIRDFLVQANRLCKWQICIAWVIFVFALQLGLGLLVRWLVGYEYHEPSVLPTTIVPYESEQILNMARVRSVTVGFGALLYGAYRGLVFYPFRDPYKSWLRQTPWTANKRLPLGPTRLVIHDLAILAVLVVPLWIDGVAVLAAVCAMLVGYFLSQLQLFYHSDQMHLLWLSGAIFASSLLLPIADLLWSIPIAILIISVVLRFAQRQALGSFRADILAVETKKTGKPGTSSSPFGIAIGPICQERWQPDYHLKLLAFCTIGSMFCFGSLLHRDREYGDSILAVIVVGMGLVLAAARLKDYLGCKSPVNRWQARRLLLPSYDIIFVAPLTTIVVGLSIPSLLTLYYARMPFYCSCPIAMFLMCMAFEYLPPDAQKWKTTGPCRMVVFKTDRHKKRFAHQL